MATKLATVIANETGQRLTMKMGDRNCFVRTASVRDGREYTMRLCMDWTYQEFVLEADGDPGRKLVVNSDDCCDYERITVKESDGVYAVHIVPRKTFCETEELDTAVATKETFWRRFFGQLKRLFWHQ
ncbi:hypothetical protein KC19_2G061700 [Ceratodon purpureus]|uniref:DUF7748 domain-containing protein n=1 Tax=Ceratodon purpureus TaxID=3225 RepID=A0A8T0IUM1_CERPU|nr:hypothetical protein KC19_2G061700 [Ceratodon purpureus]